MSMLASDLFLTDSQLQRSLSVVLDSFSEMLLVKLEDSFVRILSEGRRNEPRAVKSAPGNHSLYEPSLNTARTPMDTSASQSVESLPMLISPRDEICKPTLTSPDLSISKKDVVGLGDVTRDAQSAPGSFARLPSLVVPPTSAMLHKPIEFPVGMLHIPSTFESQSYSTEGMEYCAERPRRRENTRKLTDLYEVLDTHMSNLIEQEIHQSGAGRCCSPESDEDPIFPETIQSSSFSVGVGRHELNETQSFSALFKTDIRQSVDGLKHQVDLDLTANVLGAKSLEDHSPPRIAGIDLLRLCAFVPTSHHLISVVYRSILELLVAVGLVIYLWKAHAHGDPIFACRHLALAAYIVGGLIGLHIFTRSKLYHMLASSHMKKYASVMGFHDAWRADSSKACFVPMILWLCTSCLWVMLTLRERGVGFSLEALVATAIPLIGTMLYTALVCCQLQICCYMNLIVDNFCVNYYAERNISKGIREWNVAQAILRGASSAVEVCLIISQTTSMVSLLFNAVSLAFRDSSTHEDTVAFVQWALLVVFQLTLPCIGLVSAAGVTERCQRVGPLINSIHFDGNAIMSLERQYLVTYVEHSAAGLYVRGVRLTGLMALKVEYLTAMAAVAVILRSGFGMA